MKKILLFLIVICAFASMNTAKAQCEIDIANVGITKTGGPVDTTISGSPNCRYTFDASFDIIANNGFKYLFFHSWRTPDYVASFNCVAHTPSADIPTFATLGTAINSPNKSFLDFGFIGLGDSTFTTVPKNVTPNIATAYPAGGGVILNYAGATATVYRKGTSDTLHFDVKNITVVLSGVCSPLGSVSTDIWGSNSNSGVPKAQCYICGRVQNFDNPGISLQKTCTTDVLTGKSVNVWEAGLQTSPNAGATVVLKVYIDKDNDNIKEPGTTQDTLIYTSAPIVLGANDFQSVGPIQLPSPYCCIAPWAYYGIYITATVTGFTNDLVSPIVKQGCATLPIKLRSFEANRNRSNVDLKWVTEIEDNNKGFYVERMLSNGGWEEITFVASQATNGNSKSPLTYVLSDFNNTKGISQYRLRQVDIDGREAYSQVRSVRGEGQKSNTIIYPNPSGDGKVNIVFEGANSIRDVSLMDVSGKTLKQWKGVTNNNIHIDNLNAGFYTVRIVNLETGEQVVEKFIVNKR
jgi:hypothetical protein